MMGTSITEIQFYYTLHLNGILNQINAGMENYLEFLSLAKIGKIRTFLGRSNLTNSQGQAILQGIS